MNPLLVLGLLLVGAAVCGMALWPSGAAAAQRATAAVGAVVPGPRPLPAGGDEDLALALLALLDERLAARAVLGEQVGATMLLARSVPSLAVVHGAGVRWTDLDALGQGVLWRLCEHAASWAEHPAAALATAASERTELAFAWAGPRDRSGWRYLRVHGRSFVAEWLRRGDEPPHVDWRAFAAGGRPWLRDRLGPRLPGG